MHPQTMFSARVAPPMIGLGLLEAIPEEAILANADPDDRNGDGIRGRANQVWDAARQRTALGRFGWKAGQPDIPQQNAHAFANDMGLTSSLLPHDDCSAAQVECRRAPDGGEPEVSDNIFAQVLFYSRNLAVPARRKVDDPQVLAGKRLFAQANCVACHVPAFTTGSDASEPGWPTNGFVPIPTCCCMTWATAWRTIARNFSPAGGTGEPRRYGASA